MLDRINIENFRGIKNLQISNLSPISILGGYNKKKLQFERFESGIKDAINRAKELAIDNVELKDKLGTSVCLLVEKLIK